MSEELFAMAEIVSEITPTEPEPTRWPLFLVAYWPSGTRWKLFPETYPLNSPDMERDIEHLKSKGWTHIKVCKLPI